MEAIRRKLQAASPGLYNCTVNTNCSQVSSSFEDCWRCVYLPQPAAIPPPAGHESAKNHIVPYLVSIVCALGVAFMILTTCTIVLRYRWTRQRNSRRVASSRAAVFIDEDRGPIDHPIWHIVTIGLPQSIIDSITVLKYKRCDGLIDGADCSVCLTEFEDGDDLRLLPKCSHAFHVSCIDTWLRSHKNCPVCRAPVVNDSSAMNSAVLGSNSSQSASSGVVQMEDSEVDPAGSGETGQTRDRCDEFDGLPVEGIQISEILKSGQQIRVLSDLGQNHRVLSEDHQPVRRSVSLDASASSPAINDVVVIVDGEGSSKQEKIIEVEEEAAKDEHHEHHEHQDSGLSRMMKSTSIGRSLQKAPVSVIRSFSSSAKIISSLRGSKSQPL